MIVRTGDLYSFVCHYLIQVEANHEFFRIHISFIFGNHQNSYKMKKKTILTLLGSVLVVLFIFGWVLGSFDFTRSKRVGKTNFYLVENSSYVVGLYYQYPEIQEMFFCVLGGRITDVYWNEQYILATEYAVQNDSITGYYIVKMLPPVKKGVPWEKIGPLSKGEYEQKKQELHLNEKEMKHVSF